MNLLWRMIWTILFSRFDTKISIFDKCRTSFTVLPTDIDVLFHMNNGRYLSIMDLARTNQMIRSGFFQRFKEKGVYPVIASETIRFRKSLNLFQRFNIITHILGWDEKFIYVSQVFVRNDIICALAIVKVCFLLKANAKRLTTAEFRNIVGIKEESPTLPEWVKEWVSSDQKYHDEIAEIFLK